MGNGLDLTTRLSTDSEFKSLYSWCLQEYDADGGKVGSAVIPWDLYFHFQAGKIERAHVIRSAPYSGGKPVSERECLKCRLVSVGGEFDRPVRFSIFGTSRHIRNMTLEVVRLEDSKSEERCEVYAFPEFVYEPEFPTIPSETHPDALSFVIHLRPERYERILATLGSDPEIQLGLMVGGVSGFYASWSPDIVTSSVKILPPGKEFEPEAPEGTTIKAPSTDVAREFAVTIARVVKSEPKAEIQRDDWEEEVVALPPDKNEDMIGSSTIKQLNQIKRALWLVALLLFLMLLFKH